MQRIAKFHKVSFEQFKADWVDTFPDTPEEEIIHIYEGQGVGFAQGIFIPYGITVDDECSDVRNGGFGSTDAR